MRAGSPFRPESGRSWLGPPRRSAGGSLRGERDAARKLARSAGPPRDSPAIPAELVRTIASASAESSMKPSLRHSLVKPLIRERACAQDADGTITSVAAVEHRQWASGTAFAARRVCIIAQSRRGDGCMRSLGAGSGTERLRCARSSAISARASAARESGPASPACWRRGRMPGSCHSGSARFRRRPPTINASVATEVARLFGALRKVRPGR